MSQVAIRVEGLGKRYRIGERARYLALRDVLARSLKAPWRLLQSALSNSPNHQPQHIWALKGVSLEVSEGEVVGLIGRNGAGKTTLLKILARVTRPTEGYAEIRGRVGSLLEVGTGFHPELTGRENIYLSGAILGMSKRDIERKFDEIVAFAEIEKFLDMPVKHYSSGMYMRLAFSVAAHLEPQILLVDEVLAVGDVAFQKKCLSKMGDAAQTGRTVILVSHNMSAVLNLCSRALLLESGGIAMQGAAQDVVQRYLASLQTARDGDLSGHGERQGRGRVRFVSAWFEDGQGQTIEHAISGQLLTMVACYESELNRPLMNCRASMCVEDLLGRPLFNCSTELASNEPLNLAPCGRIRCVIPRFPLSQGRYLVSLFLEVNREVEDWLISAMTLDVVDGDFFGSGRQYPDGWQGIGVMVPHHWETG